MCMHACVCVLAVKEGWVKVANLNFALARALVNTAYSTYTQVKEAFVNYWDHPHLLQINNATCEQIPDTACVEASEPGVQTH